MPAGPAPLGFAYFLSAKLLGYTAFCRWVVNPKEIARRERRMVPAIGAAVPGLATFETAGGPNDVPSAFKSGGIRTLIGLAVGVSVGLGFWAIPYFSAHDTVGTVLFFSLLVPVRVGEWWLLFRWVYGMRPFSDSSGFNLIALGILVSFVLDALGMVTAIAFPGGIWVC